MGRVVHFEIMADDPVRAAAFYKDALGWTVATWAGGEQRYWLVTTGKEGTPGINGGIMGRNFSQAVINTVEVESLDDIADRIEKAGGKKVHGPNVIEGVGTHTYFTDTEGNLFGVIEPARKTSAS